MSRRGSKKTKGLLLKPQTGGINFYDNGTNTGDETENN